MTASNSTILADIDREIELTIAILRRHGIPANRDDAAYFVARAHERRSMDDLLRKVASGKDVRPWQVSYLPNLVRREFRVETPVLREAMDELDAAICPTHSTVTALRARIRAEPATGRIRLADLPQTGQLLRKLPHLERAGIETLDVFATEAHRIAPVWTDAVLRAFSVMPKEEPHDDGR